MGTQGLEEQLDAPTVRQGVAPGRRLHIVEPDEQAIRRSLEAELGRAVAWLYLGERIDAAESCSQWFSPGDIQLELGPVLQEVALVCKQAYIDYIGRLGVRFNAPAWWVGSIAGKNPYISKTYLHICYILATARLLQAVPVGMLVVIVTDDACVRQALAGYLGVQESSTVPPRKQVLVGLARRLWFILHHCARLLVARVLGARKRSVWTGTSSRPDPRLVLLHGWVDERSFDQEGGYHSTTLGQLDHYLDNKGWACCLLPMIPWDAPYVRTLRALIRSQTPFLLPHAWLTVGDICRAALIGLDRQGSRGAWPLFEGIDIGSLIEADMQRDWVVARVPTHLLLAFLVERWRQERLPVVGLVYSYENHQWERALCLGIRRAFPDAAVVGYQDANVPELCLNFFPAESEFDRRIFPDCVVTNGPYSFGVLRRAGYPKERLRQGGALRFEPSVAQVFQPQEAQGTQADAALPRRVVLVVAPCGKELAAEVIWKSCRAFERDAHVRVVIKCHPTLPFSFLGDVLKGVTLPPHFEVSELPFLDLLRESGVVLYMDSTTCLEALAHGVAVVHVGSDGSFDLDTIGFPCHERAKARTPDEIADAVRRVFDMDPLRLPLRRRSGRELVKTFFGSVGETAYAPIAAALDSPGRDSGAP